MLTLTMTTLTFERASGVSYVDSAGNFIDNTGELETFDVRGSLQPLSPKEKETISTKSGVLVSTAFYFYTQEEDIRPISKTTSKPDRVTIAGEPFIVKSNTPWKGINLTSHNVITLVKEDEVVLDA